KQIIQVSFDCSWSHVHNAQQESGEMIYGGKDIEGCVYATGFRKANEKNCSLQEKDI
ncbi:784_t:CDS:2, partial [Entrophospora sp. SA101]